MIVQVGLLASSPLFAEASKHYNGFKLIGIGLGVWTTAVTGCGLSFGKLGGDTVHTFAGAQSHES